MKYSDINMWLMNKCKLIKRKSNNLVYRLCRYVKLFSWRVLLKNKNFSVVCNNCLGGVVAHDLDVGFYSPTVNLYMLADDYLLFLEDMQYYVDSEIEEVTSTDKSFPVGLLGGKIYLYFMHYHSFEEAVSAWKRRVKRLNWDNLFIIIQQTIDCTDEHLQRFDRLPYTRKVAITRFDDPGVQCGFYLKGVDCAGIDLISEKSNRFGGKYYDRLDWATFFNTGKIQRSKI